MTVLIPDEDDDFTPVEASSIELRCCNRCNEPLLVLYDSYNNVICYLNLSHDSLKDFVAVVQKSLDEGTTGCIGIDSGCGSGPPN